MFEPRSTGGVLLALKDVNAVMIFTPRTFAVSVAQDGGRGWQGCVLRKTHTQRPRRSQAAWDAVLTRNLIVQIGTQHRSEPQQLAVGELYTR